MLSLDWNRMLHRKKKNLLLLPSVPKRDGGVEKMTNSKIGDEKKCLGGFLNQNKYDELNSGMQHPGLVARLMGLETMPIVNHKKPETPSSSLQFNSNRFEASEGKELRPQKLRRTGGFPERQKSVSPPAETLQFNRRVRRHQGHRISSPAKSPRLLSKKNTFRVIGQSRSNQPRFSAQYNDEESKDVHNRPCKSFGRFNELPVLRIQDKENSMEGHRNVGNKIKLRGDDRPSNLFGQDTFHIEGSSVVLSSKNRKQSLSENDARRRDHSYMSNECKRKTQQSPLEGRLYNKQQSRNKSIPFTGAKGFVGFNNGVSSFPRSRPKESGRRRDELERRNIARKRRPDNSLEGENSGTFQRQQNARGNLMDGKQKAAAGNHTINSGCVETKIINHVEGHIKGSDVVSFTFSSPMKQDVDENRRSKAKPYYHASRLKNLVSDEKIETMTSQVVNSRGDGLQAVVEQKLEDLNSLGQDEATELDDISGRSTTSILEEIISALRCRQEDSSFSDFKSTPGHTSSQSVMVKANGNLQAEVEAGTSAAFSVSDGDYPSPFSILEVSFSNDSCFSGSPYGCKPDIDTTESCKNIQLSDLDADLRDSASSMSNGKVETDIIPSFLAENSTTECSVVSYNREAMSNAELLLEDISGRKSSFHDIMEAITEGMRVRESMNVNQFEKLLFDCMIESIDSKYNILFKSRSELAWSVRRRKLTTQIHEEIRGWNDMAGKAMNDLVEMDLGRSNFVNEACQTSMEIEDEILHRLVEELVIDISN